MKFFPTTHWSVVIEASAEASQQSMESLTELCRTYWYPVYSFSRYLGDSHEDAQDLTQAFFLHLLRSRLMAKADPQAGKFRSFVAVSFRNFRSSYRRMGRSLKRGGDVKVISFEELDAEQRFAQEQPSAASLDQRFDLAWARTVLEKAHRLLETEYQAAEKHQLFARLINFLPGGDKSDTYTTVGREFGKTADAIKMELSRMRKRYRNLLQMVVGGTVLDRATVDEELRYLLHTLTTCQES